MSRKLPELESWI